MVPAFGQIDVVHNKIPNTGKGSSNTPLPCDMCGGEWSVSAPVKIGNQFVLANSVTTAINCAY
jgi:hypothetical protein